ncbi:MAG: hypothetical protein WEB87_05675 [Bacteriovoracaceae bacterium]
MKAFKRFTIQTLALTGFVALAMGGYNSMIMQNDTFMSASTDIKFVKRLDEINGKVVIGRAAASTREWKSLSQSKKEDKKEKRVEVAVNSNIQKQEAAPAAPEEVKNIPEPAIKGDLDLSLTNVFYKKPLKQGEFSGSARTVDGVIEEIFVNLPDGNVIEINTRERMMGNVFQYEDFETREIKSAMFYEVKQGVYMITLSNDSKYAGVRMEFQAGNGAEVAYGDDYYQETRGWGANNQNHNNQLANEAEYAPETEEPEYQDQAEKEETYGFNFQT